VPHTFVVEGGKPARMLTLLTPVGGERIFIEGGRPAEREGVPPSAPPDSARLQAVNPRYGAEIVGPPLAPMSATTVADAGGPEGRKRPHVSGCRGGRRQT